MLHPAAAHFAVALPVISLVLGLLYLFKPTESMSKISSRFLSFAALFIVAAYFTGKNDAKEVLEVFEALDYVKAPSLLGEHAKMGLYLALATTAVALIKMFGCYKKMFKVELLAVVLLAAVTAATLYQGKMGGELTYEHGLNVSKHAQMQNTAGEAAAAAAEAAEFADDDEDEDEEEEE
ncbi:MAG: hypothetical protein KAR81_00595 [Sulfurimonas sp.]|nr:hypothetical protein [Sulfurimonas sp.]